METKKLANKLKELRALRGMSQEYLAEESQVGLRTIQRIENNESKPTGETIKRIANALDVQLSELSESETISETADIKATIIFLKKQLSKANKKSEIKTFERFINTLTELKEKELSPEQLEAIESYLEYLELEKIPSFSNELLKKKLNQLKKYLKNKLRFLPSNYYRFWAINFGVSFAVAFSVNGNIDNRLRIGVISAAVVFAIAIIMDLRAKKQNRSLSSLRF
ncbi:helix-turn-helix domain-containing protein [Winogradskyella immobilis]|uniref:Helix-turn-helix transcriptional regulator n=1 Tax=Winogradskyella immobilis TaxID=2816852 RepID=A0ABS8ELQ5_9FLAO|nr:helix-turn-helix transcriptional regulator [Winogradskyella immobilis]MCC1484143.1 helix-turn-helix transcriptional regulator [Winogradskyella immobilis]MCG0016235.1 helix-turn-helix transcriptional regulator [Winogradskyella immobilis]